MYIYNFFPSKNNLISITIANKVRLIKKMYLINRLLVTEKNPVVDVTNINRYL